MTGKSLNLPEDVSTSLADLARNSGQNPDFLAVDVLRDYIAHEREVTQEIERAVQEANDGLFATDEEVAALRAKRWGTDAG
ncbi:CopG family transcriptional regulator [Pseudomonas sp. dw_358]|uniref:CopG family ribbon-helix-helix protein n=1 Tax=Pseudomonas sp. dw_358 TaxID=2720083 RepID=UPI001BD680A2|nr:CopG family transcriptional regulator [Pseudomonas sp. dw_358]